jgi:hypothetical protein
MRHSPRHKNADLEKVRVAADYTSRVSHFAVTFFLSAPCNDVTVDDNRLGQSNFSCAMQSNFY